MMQKKNIAVIFGGCSPEYGVSLASASAVIGGMDRSQYRPVLVGITQQGDWFYYTGGVDRILNNTWMGRDCIPACISPDRSRRALLVFGENGVSQIHLDAAFPVLHGRNGEDGTVQGLLELAGIPLAGCGALASALCMDKDRAHRLASLAGISVPKSFSVSAGYDRNEAAKQAEALGYPLFVKPVKAGSSYGVTKVSEPAHLWDAVENALYYDDRALVEEAIPGVEVGCAVLGREDLTVGEPDEIELNGGFFDFREKYQMPTAKIHVPARISPAQRAMVQDAARVVYRALDCGGFARVDFFLTPEGTLLFNEVNTIPGFTAHSRFPAMMRAAGMDLETVVSRILGEALE